MSLFDIEFIEDNVLGNPELEEVLADVERVCNVGVLKSEKLPQNDFSEKKESLLKRIDELIHKHVFDEDAGGDAVVNTLRAMKEKVAGVTGEKLCFYGKNDDINSCEMLRFNALVNKKLSELR